MLLYYLGFIYLLLVKVEYCCSIYMSTPQILDSESRKSVLSLGWKFLFIQCLHYFKTSDFTRERMCIPSAQYVGQFISAMNQHSCSVIFTIWRWEVEIFDPDNSQSIDALHTRDVFI